MFGYFGKGNGDKLCRMCCSVNCLLKKLTDHVTETGMGISGIIAEKRISLDADALRWEALIDQLG